MIQRIKKYLRDRKSIKIMEREFGILMIESHVPNRTVEDVVSHPFMVDYLNVQDVGNPANKLAQQIMIAKRHGVDVMVMRKLAR